LQVHNFAQHNAEEEIPFKDSSATCQVSKLFRTSIAGLFNILQKYLNFQLITMNEKSELFKWKDICFYDSSYLPKKLLHFPRE
jgi:hypothetical protein